jgi:hypothetical protein
VSEGDGVVRESFLSCAQAGVPDTSKLKLRVVNIVKLFIFGCSRKLSISRFLVENGANVDSDNANSYVRPLILLLPPFTPQTIWFKTLHFPVEKAKRSFLQSHSCLFPSA